jgi:hypothetical protein
MEPDYMVEYQIQRIEAVMPIVIEKLIEEFKKIRKVFRINEFLIGRHAGFIALCPKNGRYPAILTPIDAWENGGTDPQLTLEVESCFIKNNLIDLRDL